MPNGRYADSSSVASAPNRVGKWGIFQSVADMIKILLKELVHIDKSDKVLFRMASFFVIIGSICTFGALPFAKGLQAIDFNVGVFYLLAVSSLGVVGILLAGWSSNSKYSMIGAMRSGAQLISYEISAGLSLMVIVVFFRHHAALRNRGPAGRRMVHLQRDTFRRASPS